MTAKPQGADWNIEQLDSASLQEIADIAARAKESLIHGIGALRRLDETANADAQQAILDELGKLTMAWDDVLEKIRTELEERTAEEASFPLPRIIH